MNDILSTKQDFRSLSVKRLAFKDPAQAREVFYHRLLNETSVVGNTTATTTRPTRLINSVLLLIVVTMAFSWATTSAQSLRTPKGVPPSRHMPPPNKNQRRSPGPVRNLGPAISHRTINGHLAICSDQIMTYSAGDWQYAILSLCTFVEADGNLNLTIFVTEAQYKWGSRWIYNSYPMDIVGLKVQVSQPGYAPTVWRPDSAPSVTGEKGSFKYHDYFLSCPGIYSVKFLSGSLQGMYYKDPAWAVPLSLAMQTTQAVGPPGQYALDAIITQMRDNPAVPLAFQFGPDFEIPASSLGALCALRQPGTLLVVQHFSSLPDSASGQLIPYLLGDTHTGPANRCEMNSNAVADGTREIAEIFTPVAAWGRLGGPDFAINANYFDVRPQNGTTWLQTQCSVPLGVYYDNDLDGPSTGTHNATDNKYLAGPGYFVDKDGDKAPEDTLFWIHRVTAGPPMIRFTITRSATADSNAATAQAARYEASGYTFVAFSGTALIPAHLPGAAPDSGSVFTTRIGIGYDEPNDILYIFEGGSYKDGVNRTDLTAIFQALGATAALEVDGGGSASLVIREGSARWGGQSLGVQPANSCPHSGAWCSPVNQPDGNSRPVPSWLGMNFSHSQTSWRSEGSVSQAKSCQSRRRFMN